MILYTENLKNPTNELEQINSVIWRIQSQCTKLYCVLMHNNGAAEIKIIQFLIALKGINITGKVKDLYIEDYKMMKEIEDLNILKNISYSWKN